MPQGIIQSVAAIAGTGLHLPPHVVTNEELCASFNAWVLDTNGGQQTPAAESSPDFIEKVSGIRQRYLVDRAGVLSPERMAPNIRDRSDEELSVQAELAVGAAREALRQAGRCPEEVDLVILGASSLQRPYPALAIEVQAALGARGFAFDVSVGCASASVAIELASNAIRTTSARCALVCAPEVPSGYSNFRDRDSHFILGDAAVAAVIEPIVDARRGSFEILSSASSSIYSNNVRNNCGFLNRCDPEHRDDADKLFYQEGRKVFRDVVQLVPKLVRSHLAKHALTPQNVARYWLHQANASMNACIMRRLLGRDCEPSEAPTVLADYANTASAGAILAFHRHREDLHVGALGVICAFGAGYTVSSHIVRRIG